MRFLYLVEDKTDFEAVKSVLQDLGHEVVQCRFAENLADEVATAHFDGLIIEAYLSIFSGLEGLERIKSPPPFVIYTKYVEVAIKDLRLFSKSPFSLEQVIKRTEATQDDIRQIIAAFRTQGLELTPEPGPAP